ncbi:MAG: hypothetical protein JJ934_08235 [Pseudomonadales bacterium]|nr:hypothetical protein [Pseudomonadales bacterium]
MRIRIWVTCLCLVVISPCALADYLKFETSGGSHDPNTAFALNTNTWMKVSIVNTYPTDGPVHFPNSRTGAYTLYRASPFIKDTNVDYTSFYVADVPRSVTLIKKSDGTRQTITHGDPQPADFPGAPSPAFLLPSGLLVTTGLSADYEADVFRVFLAATMPSGSTANTNLVFGIPHTMGNNKTSKYSLAKGCTDGWAVSPKDGEGFTMMNPMAIVGFNAGCGSATMSEGTISHIVSYE